MTPPVDGPWFDTDTPLAPTQQPDAPAQQLPTFGDGGGGGGGGDPEGYDPAGNLAFETRRAFIPIDEPKGTNTFEWRIVEMLMREVGDEESSESESESSESSSSESSESESSEPSSESSEPSSSSSSKDTAIVRVPWSPTGFAALFATESPEVRFEDVWMDSGAITLPRRETKIQIDPRFVSVCEPGSIRVCGYAGETPCPLGFRVERHTLSVIAPRWPVAQLFGGRPRGLTIKLTATRRGFKGVRFSQREEWQFLANEYRLRLRRDQAHPIPKVR